MRQKFLVTGMTCSACSAHVEKAVSALDGVTAVNVNLLAGSMQVDFDPARQNNDSIVKAVIASGYGASVPGGEKRAEKKTAAAGMEEELKGMKRRLTLSIILLIPLMYVAMGGMMGLPVPTFLSGMENALISAFTQFLIALPSPSLLPFRIEVS